ncbi:MAG: flavoprotein [Bdellovibrionaceae bacterium]|nr:flavoprotein [Pseudobdellovibrionaceae bacterium]|tara:strand:+ start:185 stop:754 length:570 start_codon:yes stop_codon:yes gene_type:complete
MFYIIVGTNRPDSRSRQVAEIVKAKYSQLEIQAEIIDLAELDLTALKGSMYGQELEGPAGDAIKKINHAEALVMVVPEYNGGVPGVLKHFMDYWSYPVSFEYRPVSYIGLGGRWGGLRPVEHLQQIFGYRNAYSFPERVFLSQVWDLLKDGEILDRGVNDLLSTQVDHFAKFVRALQGAGLDANSNRPG